jgi:ribulose 1,5-bisphosphate synthetase/thiazole synthase
VTSMDDTDQNRADINLLAKGVFNDVLLIGRGPSKLQAARTMGYEVDIWIDDNPYAIV